nr:hypothetical protein [Tanacetum cinerariifolium]
DNAQGDCRLEWGVVVGSSESGGKIRKRCTSFWAGKVVHRAQCIVCKKRGSDGIVCESGRKCGGEGLQGMAGNLEVGE